MVMVSAAAAGNRKKGRFTNRPYEIGIMRSFSRWRV